VGLEHRAGLVRGELLAGGAGTPVAVEAGERFGGEPAAVGRVLDGLQLDGVRSLVALEFGDDQVPVGVEG
jgi:hypothetical protein